MLHEHHSRTEVILKTAVASVRTALARALGAGPQRMAREEKRLAIAKGMMDGFGTISEATPRAESVPPRSAAR
jgi:hypothetical protein